MNGSAAFYIYGPSSANPNYASGNTFEYNYIKDPYYYGSYFYYQNGLKLNYDSVVTSSSGIQYGFYCYYVEIMQTIII